MQLVIGNKNYSSWSLRPWLLLRHFNVEFEEIRIPLFVEGYQERLRPYSPSQRVPALLDDGLKVWDSLSICEYINEKYLDGHGLPANLAERSQCRSYCCEMHAGFAEIRSHLPMNCRASKRLQLSKAIMAECERIDAMWVEARERNGAAGPYLFGSFSIADCFFAPVVFRFRTYKVPVSDPALAYMETMLSNSALRQWLADATREPEVLSAYEIGEDLDS